MIAQARRLGLFAAYQVVLLIGIALMPVALVGRRFGVPVGLPGRAVEALGRAYDDATASTR